MQSVEGVINTSFGYGSSYNNANTVSNALSDDFVVPAGETWQLASTNIYAYQTGFTGTGLPIDAARVWITNGIPSSSTSQIIFGNSTSNIINTAASAFSSIYRVSNTTGTDTNRAIYRINATTVTTLTPGTYWVIYQMHATNDLSLFTPPVTIVGARNAPNSNLLQRNINNVWVEIFDNSTVGTFPAPQAAPFELNYTVLSTSSENLITTKIFPNPAQNFIELTSSSPLTKIQLLDVNGRVIENITANSQTNMNINVVNLNSGVYILNMETEDGKTSKRFIKN